MFHLFQLDTIIWYLHDYDYINIIHNQNYSTLNSYQCVPLVFFLGAIPPESLIPPPRPQVWTRIYIIMLTKYFSETPTSRDLVSDTRFAAH